MKILLYLAWRRWCVVLATSTGAAEWLELTWILASPGFSMLFLPRMAAVKTKVLLSPNKVCRGKWRLKVAHQKPKFLWTNKNQIFTSFWCQMKSQDQYRSSCFSWNQCTCEFHLISTLNKCEPHKGFCWNVRRISVSSSRVQSIVSEIRWSYFLGSNVLNWYAWNNEDNLRCDYGCHRRLIVKCMF